MRRLEIVLIQIFAAIGSYLIVSMPFAFGFQISVFTTDDQEFQTSMPDFDQLIEREFSFPYRMNIQYARITLSSKDPGKTIKKVYLYRCKDYNPVECLQNGILPAISVSPFNATLWFNDETRWSDVQRNDVANFLILVKMEMEGKEVWTGSWDIIEEEGVRQFAAKNYDLDKLNVYLKPGVQGETVKNYIESYLSVPTNWVDHSVLTLVEGSPVSKLYELTGNEDEVDPSVTGTPTFHAGILTGNSFEGSSKEWAFIFGGDGKISNPVAFYNSGGEPPVVSEAKLKVDTWNPQTVTCGSQEVISVTAHVENASAINCGEEDCYFQDYHYTIDGVQSSPGSITCSISDPLESIYEYQCSIPVDEFPVCSPPKTSTLSLHFTYKNAVTLSGEFPVTLQTPPAGLIVNSVIPSIFDCGIDTELTANLRVTNPPVGSPSKHYTFDGVNFETMSCSGSGGTFICRIPENEICSLLQEDLDITFKFEYSETEVTSSPVNIKVTFPPPSLGIDTVTPEVFTSGQITSTEVLLHVNYPDSLSYTETDFKYKYLDNSFQSATCTLHNSFTNMNYYKCSIELDIPSGREGVDRITFRLDGYQGSQLKSLLANYMITIKSPPPEPSLTIISTSSPLDCVKDSSLTVQAKVENIQGTPTTEYSLDSETFEPLTCSGSGGVYECYIPKGDLCPLMTNSLDLVLKFSYPEKELVSNSQKVYLNLPEPHMQVYSVFPDVLPVGKTTQTTVNLYIQYPETIGTPKFVYSYLDKADESMSCQKVSSTSNRDYYRCSQTSFAIPSDYSGDHISVIFAVEGTTLTYPYNIKITTEEVGIEPWFEIHSTIPGKIEIEPGNTSDATLLITVHNAVENDLKHSASLQPTKWITSGTCVESEIDYDFSCDVKITPPGEALTGENQIDVTIRVSDGKTYTLTNQTRVYLLPGEFQMDIQSITPDKLYCQGHKQTNPEQVKVNAKLMNLQADSLLQEKIIFDGQEIQHADRYCTFQAGSITCNIPTAKLLEKVTCGQGELAPGEGLHYYSFSLSVLLKKGEEFIQVSGSTDLGVEAIPLQAYLEITDSDIENGFLKESINCLGSKTIRLGDGGNYIRIRYADLLHQTPEEDDLTWSFRLDAYDESGKLTKGMGSSPTANATICKMKSYQQVGVHRYEDYECTLFVDRQMFQRCATGEGTITLTVLSKTMGRSAEGEFQVAISRGEEDFNLYIQVEKDASDEITCWVVSEDGRCNLERSQLNATLSVKNRAKGDIGDLRLLDSDIQLKGGDIDMDVYSPYCRETAKGTRRFQCGFGIKPSMKIEEKVSNQTEQEQIFKDIDLGELEFTALVKYADGLAEDSLKANIGSVTISPEKDPNFLDYQKQKEKMKDVVGKVKGIMKKVLTVAGFCVTCAAGTWIYRKIAGDDNNGGTNGGTNGGNGDGSTSPYYDQSCIGSSGRAGKCKYPQTCGGVSEQAKNNGCGETSGLECCIQTSLLGGDGYGPGASKIGLSSPVFLQECINCVVNEKKPWCIESNKCEPCDYQISTEESCRALYQEVTVEGEEPETPLPGSIIPGPAYDIPSPTMPTTEIVNMLNQQIQEAENKGKTAKNWWEAVGALIAFGALFALAVWWLSGKVKGEGTSEYTNALAKGMRYGLICLVLQIVGGWLSGKEGAVETIGEGMTGFGDILYNVCIFLAENFPALIALLSVVMRWITFEACMEDIERSLDQGYYGSGEGASAYRSGLVGTRSALSKLDACMNQFNQISQDAWRIGQSMYYSGVGLWGSASFRLYKTKPSEKEITGTATICKDEPVRYKFKNWCKVIMEKGHDAQFIKITSSSGNECNPETIISAEYCRGQYGYGYGWGSGWGTGGYRPLYQAPGSSKDDFIPVNQCPEDDKNTGYTYTISVPGVSQYYTLEYDPTC